jgi:hypothetical protein
MTLRLWDESGKKLVGYRHLRDLRRARARGAQSNEQEDSGASRK